MSASLEPTAEQVAALARWDAIMVVEYPMPSAFLDMVSNEEYRKVHEHRAAELDRGDLIATSIWTLAE
jgi:hypothetical protein